MNKANPMQNESDPCCETPGKAPDRGQNGEALPGDETLASLCKALAHPTRLAILRHLAAMDRCVCGRIVDVLPLAQSTVSQHLKILKEAGLVRGEVDGPRMCYCVDKDALARLKELVGAL